MKCLDEYQINDEALVHRSNSYVYLGTISEIRDDLFLIKYDDGADEWSELNRLKKLPADNAEAMCIVCKQQDSDSIRICCQCHRGFHEKCTSKSDQNQMKWSCHNCTTVKHTDDRSNIIASSVNRIDKTNSKFPYDLDSLTWDTYHRQNTEHIYCYCGKKGKWFLQMLQCVRCQQWFHAKCVKCINSPLYFGDRFYLFACANCNHGVEFLRRLHMNIEDVVHLLLFNLTLHFSKRYYNLTNVLFPYARDNWHALQLPSKLKNMISNEVKDEITKALKSHPDRFKAGSEVKKKVLNWSLVSRAPPKAPHIVLPPGPLLTEKYINDLFYEPAQINFISQNVYNAVEVTCSDAKIKDFMFGKSVAPYINNNSEASEDTASSEDLESVLSSVDKDILSELILYKDQEENDVTTVLKTTNGDDSLPKPIEGEIKSKRRGRPRFNLNDKSKDSPYEFIYSSDDISNRSMLDSIIPPPKNFSGINNPFLIDTSKRSFGSVSNENSKTHFQLVRTVKRRLSANDIIIGPNMEVKRRKLNKKRMENVEVISTSSLADLPKSVTYLPLTADSKRVSIAAIRSSLKERPTIKAKNGFKKHISEPINSPSSSTSLISSISSSSIKDTMKEESMADLQTSLNMYSDGMANRIGSGQKFVIKGKRILTDGRTQYLIDLEGVS